jgi:hypothetical protein
MRIVQRGLERLGAEAASDMVAARRDPPFAFGGERTWLRYWRAPAHRFPIEEKTKWPRLFGSRVRVDD